MTATTAPVTPKVHSGRSFVLRIVPRVAIALAVLGIAFFGVLPRVANMEEVGGLIWSMPAGDMTLAIVIAALALLSHGLGIMATTPGHISYSNALTENQSASAICNVVPGGGALTVVVNYEQYKSWGLTAEDYSLMVVVSGIWNNFIKLGMPVVAVVILGLTGEFRGPLVLAAVAGLVVLAGAVALFAGMFRSQELTRRVGVLAGRIVTWLRTLVHHPKEEQWGDAEVQTREQALDLVRARWLRMTWTLLLPTLLEYFLLLFCLRGLGVGPGSVGWDDVLVAYSVAKLLTVIPVTPGGLGVLDLGLVGILVAAGGDQDQVVAATLLWRGLTFLPTIPVGAVLGARWWRWNRKRTARIATSP